MNKFFEKTAYRADLFLKPTGAQVYGMDEYVYINKLDANIFNRSIKGSFLRLIVTATDAEGFKEFDILPFKGSDESFYFIKDNLGLRDINGNPVYAINTDGSIKMADVDVEQEDEPIVVESRPVDMLNMFSDNIDLMGDSLATLMFGTIKKSLYNNPEV